MSLDCTPNEILLEIASQLPIPALNAFLRTNTRLSLLLAPSLIRHAKTTTYELPALFNGLTTSNGTLIKHVLTHGFAPATFVWAGATRETPQRISFTVYTATGMVTRTHMPPATPPADLVTLLTSHGATTTVSVRGTASTPLCWAIYHNLLSAPSLIPHSHMSTDARLCFDYLNAAPTRINYQSPLHIASARNPELIPALLAAGADSRTRDSRGYTPLHTAASLGVLPAVKHLLAAGADPDGWCDIAVWTPLALAAWYCHSPVVAVLLDAGAVVNRVLRKGAAGAGAEGFNVLHRLVARMAVAHSGLIWTDVSGCQKEPWNAAWEGIFRMLMERGADPTAPDGKGRSPRVLAREYGMLDVMDVLGEVWPWEKVGYKWWSDGGWGRLTGNEVCRGGKAVVITERAWRVKRREERYRLVNVSLV